MRPADDRTEVRKRSLTISGHRTSISLEDAFWDGLQAIADRDTCSLASLVADVDRGRGAANLSSAVRVFVLNSLKADARPGEIAGDRGQGDGRPHLRSSLKDSMRPLDQPGLVVRQKSPLNLEFQFATLRDWLTPVDQYYVRSHFPTPDVRIADGG